MNFNTLKKELRRAKKLGFVPSHRVSDTGIGKTLEDLLHIKENNIPLHDITDIAELKACRRNTRSMLTLFTLEPLPKGGDRDRMLLDNFGYSIQNEPTADQKSSTRLYRVRNITINRLNFLYREIKFAFRARISA